MLCGSSFLVLGLCNDFAAVVQLKSPMISIGDTPLAHTCSLGGAADEYGDAVGLAGVLKCPGL